MRGFMDRYFLDESGHGGDLASSASLDFSGQPVFALACVGVNDEKALVAELERLRAKYRCGKAELKSSTLGKKLSDLASDLIEWLVAHDAAIFAELVEKRYFLTIHIVNHLLCGPYDLVEVDQHSRSSFAELLNEPEFASVQLAYLGACRSEEIGDLRDVLNLLWDALDRFDEDVARDAQILTMYARDRASTTDARASDFLPIHDVSDAGKKVWMLPNLQCLTNIYARINQSRIQNLSAVVLVHDVQLQYGKILGEAKETMEDLSARNAVPITPFADYRLRGNADLIYCHASEETCLQVADILAGSMMRFVRSGLDQKVRGDTRLRDAFFQLYDYGNPFRATGLNLVVSDRVLDRLGIATIAAAPFVR